MGGKESKVEESSKADKTSVTNKIKSIRSSIKASRIYGSKETIKINASLYNNGLDTAYFLTRSCEGEQYSLHYDTSKLELTPFVLCNAVFLKFGKIAPKGQYDFQAHFRCKRSNAKIKLGFDLYSVDKTVDTTNQSLADLDF